MDEVGEKFRDTAAWASSNRRFISAFSSVAERYPGPWVCAEDGEGLAGRGGAIGVVGEEEGPPFGVDSVAGDGGAGVAMDPRQLRDARETRSTAS